MTDDEVRIRRVAQRAAYDRQSVYDIVDAALIAHVGTVRDGRPVVIPMLAVRDGAWLLLHGAPAAGTFRRARNQPICVEMTLLDGIVLARSAFHHSLNYRSVVVHGVAEMVRGTAARERALERFVERLMPGRSERLRPMTPTELKQTTVMRLSLELASAKVRTGPPVDEEKDYEWPVWAGVLPVATTIGRPVADPRLRDGVEIPPHVHDLADTTR